MAKTAIKLDNPVVLIEIISRDLFNCEFVHDVSTPYNQIKHSTGYVTSAIISERGYLELILLYMERHFNIY